MRFRLAALVTAALALLGVGVAGPAHATGYSTTLACVSGGSQFRLVQYYDLTNSVVTLTSHSWTSTPAAQFDRVTFSIQNGAGGNYLAYAMGNASSSQNDVDSSGTSAAEHGTFSTVYAPGNPTFRISVWGGVGNSSATCNSTVPIVGT